MKTVLIVEDDSFKSNDIVATIRCVRSDTKCILETSVAGAVTALNGQIFDLIVLDMALPSHQVVAGQGAPLSLLNGGVEVLLELQSLERTDQCVVITQYPEIEICGDLLPVARAAEAMAEAYGIRIGTCLEYSQTNYAWRQALTEVFTRICES